MQSNIANRTIFCHDNLDVLRGIDSQSIDLIYLDPPFNKKKVFNAPIGSSAVGAEFSDIFRQEDIKDEWLLAIKEDHDDIFHLLESVKRIEGRTSYNFCYLAYMGIRLMECHRVLKNTGSLYLHCDPTMSHYLKLLLDCIFNENNFKNEIVWSYRTGGVSKRWFARKHDVILFYGKSKNILFNVRKERSYSTNSPPGFKNVEKYKDEHGRWYTMASMRDIWEINVIGRTSAERTGYPTQKPLALLERVIAASSNAGDVVLDPFCGCATTCVAAERLGRQWVGIDISVKAYDLVRQRLGKEVEWKNTLFEEELITFSASAPQRTDRGADEREQKYVYIISNKQYPGEYKVGIASDVKRRLSSYQTADPNRDYRFEYKLLTPHFRAIEAYIHEVCENKHEWVAGNLADIRTAIKAKHNEWEGNR